jgi:hypothetical protein
VPVSSALVSEMLESFFEVICNSPKHLVLYLKSVSFINHEVSRPWIVNLLSIRTD